jgi:CubicO group peptidase (beta-lactamase class C family)
MVVGAPGRTYCRGGLRYSSSDMARYLGNHTGSTLGFSSFAEFCPERKYAVVVLANQLGHASALSELAATVERNLK